MNLKKSENKSLWEEVQFEMEFSDVTLACEDKQIQVHKIVMAWALSVPH